MSKIVKVTVEIINGEESNVLNISSPMNNREDKANAINNMLDKIIDFIGKHEEQKNTDRCSRQQYEPAGDLSRKAQTVYGGFSFDFASAKTIKRRNLRRHLGFPFTVNKPTTKARYKGSINLLRLSKANSIIGSKTDINLLDARYINIELSLGLLLETYESDLDKLIKLNSSEQSALISYLLNCSKIVDVNAIDKIAQEGIYASKEDINILMDKVLPSRMAEIHKALSEARADSKHDFDGNLVNTNSYALMNPELPNKKDNTIAEKSIKYPIAPIDFSILDSDSEMPAFIISHTNSESTHSLILISDKNMLNDINQDTAFFLITDVKENINKYFNLCEKENFGTYFNIPEKNSVINDINKYLSNRKNVYISEYAILRIMGHYDISYSELRNEILDYDETPINLEEMKSMIKHHPLADSEINSLLEAATETNLHKIKTSAGEVSISLSDKVVYIHPSGEVQNNRFVESLCGLPDLLKIINSEELLLVDGYKDKLFSYPVLISKHLAKQLAFSNIDKSLLFSKIFVVGEAEDEFVKIGKNEIVYYQEISAPFQNAVLTSQRIFGDILKEQPIEDFICVDGWYAKDSNKKAVALRSVFKQIKDFSRGLDVAIKEIKLKEDK